jgi:PAS domain-containing protein
MNRLDAAGSVFEACMLPGAGVTLEFLAAIVDHIAHPIFVKDREYRFVLLNRAVADMLRIPRESTSSMR